MSEKVQDAVEFVKGHPASKPVIGILLLCILFVTFCSDSPSRREGRVNRDADPLVIQEGEEFDELVKVFEQRLRSNEDTVKGINEGFERLRSDNEQVQGLIADTLETFSDRLETIEQQINRLSERPTQVIQQHSDPTINTSSSELVPEEPVTITFAPDAEEIAAQAGPKPQQTRIATITAGDSARVTLLTGVNAPTDGTPYPVVFKLSGPITGPDGATLELGEARLLALATGSEIDSRAVYRLQTLAIRYPDGRRAVVDVDGWVVGEDGIRGMQGRLVDKLGSFIIQILGTSFVADVLSGASGQRGNISVDNGSEAIFDTDNLDQAFANSLNEAGNRLIDVYIDRLEGMVPVIEILAGREAAAVFSVSVEVYVCDQGQCGENGGSVFASLD